MTDANSLEAALKNQQWVGGQAPTSADNDAYNAVKDSNLSAETHPYTFAWFCLVSKFSDAVRNEWAAGAAAKGGAKGGKAAAGKKGGKGGDKKEAKKEEEDELDLFGDDDDDGAAAAAAAKAKEAAKGKKKKAPVIAKSSVLFEVKPLDDQTNLDDLFKKITTEIVMDGLVWGVDCKKVPVAFGIFKLMVACVVEDDKVSVDDLQEKIEAFEEFV